MTRAFAGGAQIARDVKTGMVYLQTTGKDLQCKLTDGDGHVVHARLNPVNERYLTTGELCRRWSVHRDTLRKMVTGDPIIVTLRFNTRAIRYSLVSILRYEAAHRR